ncbi:MAG: phosphodiester glycosidase family protein [Candidatus Woesebacteria bacterium]|nr:MAG: phosphodiester glycosidase family protein [Candidatus Woesebacteria bacterium]
MPINLNIKKIFIGQKWMTISLVAISAVLLLSIGYSVNLYLQNTALKATVSKNTITIQEINKELTDIKSADPYKTNTELKKQIDNIQKTFTHAVTIYEKLLDLENPPKEIKGLDTLFANILVLLGKQDYIGAEKGLDEISSKIAAEQARIAATSVAAIPKNVPVSTSVPNSGSYSKQQVATDRGNFLVDIIAGDLGSTRVIVDTASDSTCANDCPVLPLATYVARNGAYAGVNGSYFCPSTYPTCAGKTNSFDLLLMNKNKTYFNSDNNVYSTNPGVIFGGSYVRFVSAVSQWGRDTGIDSMLSNYPLLVSGGNITFGGNDDPKQGSKGNRSFVANKGNTVYIGVAHNVTVAESAIVMKAMGMENALNLDSGGSTALWYGGYKAGPGRDLPNVILFIKK